MQLKLLNFYKILAKISTAILGSFVALIVYKKTQNFVWAFAYIAGFNLAKFIFEKLLNNASQSHPQLILFLRTIPVLISACSMLLFNTQLIILGIFLVLIFQALSETMGVPPMEYIFSYSAEGKSSTSTGVTRMFEIVGFIIAILIGGIMLDYIPIWIVILVSISLYIIAVIPLVVYAAKQKGNKYFNKEVTSNATESFNKNEEKRKQHKYISKRILNKYYFIYILMCFYDALMSLICLYLFKENSEMYVFAAYIKIAYYGMYGVGSLLTSKLDQKKDITNFVVVSSVVGAGLIIASPFVISILWLEILIYGLVGLCLSIISLFTYSRMMTRCKILGISNKALTNRERATVVSQGIIGLMCMPSVYMFIPAFIFIGLTSLINAYAIPKNEEIVRKYLVDYLQNNGMY